ncbi:pyridoxal 5'-phosphate synthase glutaminase subunit PdxT [candidate division KSB1 bacterium]|jgi:5'-phosphate synthase pdxT subunit|nr:pyridoxal 5'-phosphate synthase glutaminase subunit PdxT [candidate division KSB1 bacterium]
MIRTIGILSIQGDFAKHQVMLQGLGVETLQVKTIHHLKKCDGLVIPGGESTTLVHLLHKHDLWEPLKAFGQQNPVYGTCAGLITLATHVPNAPFTPMGLIDLSVQRNAYGRQIDSFIAPVQIRLDIASSFEGVFIRAPKITKIGNRVTPLGWYEDNIVLAESGHILVSTFHPELTDNDLIHRYFLKKIG